MNLQLTYKKLVNLSLPALKNDSIYSFDEDQGFFSFLLAISVSDALGYFDFYGEYTSPNSSVLNLLRSNEACWISSDQSNSKIRIRFFNAWTFHPTSFKIKSGPNLFPRSLKLVGITYEEEITLGEFQVEEYLISPCTLR